MSGIAAAAAEASAARADLAALRQRALAAGTADTADRPARCTAATNGPAIPHQFEAAAASASRVRRCRSRSPMPHCADAVPRGLAAKETGGCQGRGGGRREL